MRLQWVDTKSNPADLLTKAVPSKALFDKFAKLIMGAVDDTAKVFLLSLRSVLVKGRRRMHVCGTGTRSLRMYNTKAGGRCHLV